MRRSLVPMAFALVASLAAAVPAQAQGEALQPELDVQYAYLTGESSDGIYPGYEGTLEAPWTLTFADPATAAEELAGGAKSIAWSLDCPEPLTMPASSTVVEFVPGQAKYTGTASLKVLADPAAPGVTGIPCTLTGAFAGTSMQAQDVVETTLVVIYQGDINVTAPVPDRTAGPQKMIRYAINITNKGNAPTLVTFESGKDLKGKWQIILPDRVLLERGETKTVYVSVATPFENGYNKGSTDLSILLHSVSAADPELTGPSTSVDLHANVQGFYVPGPSLAVLALALGLATVVVRVRRN